MKILFIESDINNSLLGLRSDFVNHLKLKGHSLFLAGGVPYGSSFGTIEQKYVSNEDKIKLLGKFSNNLKSIFTAFIRLLFFAYQSKPQFCFVFNIKPIILWGLINKFFCIPSVCTVTGTITFRNGDQINKSYKKIIAFALKSYKYVVFQNEFDFLLFKSMIDSSQISYIIPGSGVDIYNFRPIENKKSDVNFLLIARLVKEKGILEYLAAARILKIKYPGIAFGLLGPIYTNSTSGSSIEIDVIEHFINEFELNYYGESKDVKKYISRTECFVLPSYGEGISNVLLEAGAMGIPLITTDVPGCREIVDNGRNGFVCEAKNVESLVEAMEKFICLSDSEKKEMGYQSRKKIEAHFSKNLVIEKYTALINES